MRRSPDPPKPWASTGTPSARSGPPYHMTDMIAAEPALARTDRRAGSGRPGPRRRLAGAIRDGVDRRRSRRRHRLRDFRARRSRGGRDVARGGCRGRSAARDDRERPGVRALARRADARARDRRLARGRHAGDVCRARGGAGRGRANGRHHRERPLARRGACGRDGRDRRSSIRAGATQSDISARWSRQPRWRPSCRADRSTRRELERILDAGASDTTAAEADRGEPRRRRPGHRPRVREPTAPAGRELVLKIEEASWLPSAFRDLETFLHGHLPRPARTPASSSFSRIALGATRVSTRARTALAAARAVGVRSAAILAADLAPRLDPSLTPAGRLLVARGAGPLGARRRADRDRDAAPAPDRTTGPCPRDESGPDAPGRPGLPRSRGAALPARRPRARLTGAAP